MTDIVNKDTAAMLADALRLIAAKDTTVNGEYGYFACIARSALAAYDRAPDAEQGSREAKAMYSAEPLREAFEFYVRANWTDVTSRAFMRDGGDGYVDPVTHECWRTWEAAHDPSWSAARAPAKAQEDAPPGSWIPIGRIEDGRVRWMGAQIPPADGTKLYGMPPIDRPASATTGQAALLEWALSRWRAEVKNKPIVNVHRRALDDVWRQVIRYAGGDPDALVGPSHDEADAAKGKS